MTYLLEAAGHPEVHGVRPRSLKVTTISALMPEAAKGQADLSQLAIRGYYRAVAAQDMDTVYSRNITQKQLFVSDFARSAFQKDTITPGRGYAKYVTYLPRLGVKNKSTFAQENEPNV